MKKSFIVARICDHRYAAECKAQHVMIAADGECWHVIRRRDQLWAARWRVGDKIEVEMEIVVAVGGGEYLTPVWRLVGGEFPLKFDLHSPYDAVAATWGVETAEKVGKPYEIPERRTRKRSKKAKVQRERRVYSRKYVCWITSRVEGENAGEIRCHLMATADGEAWEVWRDGPPLDPTPIWKDGEIVNVRLQLSVDKKTGDRWLEPDWQNLGATGLQTRLSPPHEHAVAEYFRSVEEQEKKRC